MMKTCQKQGPKSNSKWSILGEGVSGVFRGGEMGVPGGGGGGGGGKGGKGGFLGGSWGEPGIAGCVPPHPANWPFQTQIYLVILLCFRSESCERGEFPRFLRIRP
jgi:hypothetical protein